MNLVNCPSCSQALAIQTQPPDGRLMCPVCSTVFIVAPAASLKSTPSGTRPQPSLAPKAGLNKAPASSGANEVLKIAVGGIVGLTIGYGLLRFCFPHALESGSKQPSVASAPAQEDTPTLGELPLPAVSAPTDQNPIAAQPSPVALSTNGDESSPSTATSASTSPTVSPTSPFGESTPRAPQVAPRMTASPPRVATKSSSDPFENRTPREFSDLAGGKSEAVNAVVRPDPKGDMFPTSVALPSRGETDWVVLLKLPESAADTLELIPAIDAAVSHVTLVLDRRADCAAAGWSVRFEWKEKADSQAVTGTLAMLQRTESNELQFRWQDVHPVAAMAIGNAWLKLSADGQTRFVGLRRPLDVASIKLNFEEERQIVPLDLEACPPGDQIFVEVSALSALGATAAFGKAGGSVKLDRELLIEFNNLPGAQIAIKLARIPQAPLGLIVVSRFKENATRQFDLSFSQLEKTVRAATESLREAEAKVPALNTALQQAQGNLRTAETRSTSNDFQARQKRAEVTKLSGVVRDANRRLTNMQEQGVQSQARLEAVPKVVAFLRELQGKQLPYRVVVKGAAAELVLAEGSASP